MYKTLDRDIEEGGGGEAPQTSIQGCVTWVWKIINVRSLNEKTNLEICSKYLITVI